ncbi:MAG: phage virion morphogenesis protein [Dysgonamonadaceae bacterium]|jgi:phage gpG-like protein|nr:phage virion morphogenesis protein [Dysgonamonadaceae bacterium]
MDFNQFKKKIITDIKVELSDEFDKNFERKAFFSQTWPDRKIGRKGSLLLVSGRLRRSLKSTVTDNRITWTSDTPYADIQNSGGDIIVTRKMKKFFWAKYYELSGKINYKKSGEQSRSTQKYSLEAKFYKGLALKKVGDKLTIPKRQFIGNAPEVGQAIQRALEPNMRELEQFLYEQLKQRK